MKVCLTFTSVSMVSHLLSELYYRNITLKSNYEFAISDKIGTIRWDFQYLDCTPMAFKNID